MNLPERVLDWLYRENLQIDEEWSERFPGGFRWWGDRQAQVIEVVEERRGPDGDTGYLFSVRTDVLRGVDLDDRAARVIDERLMYPAALAGPVHDPETGTLHLESRMVVHEAIAPWAQRALSLAAVFQLHEARTVGPELARDLGAELAESGPPGGGLRRLPDSIVNVAPQVIVPVGLLPSRWSAEEFREFEARYLGGPPAVFATAGETGITAEFPWGKNETCLCQVSSEVTHPRYGNGLAIRMMFPLPVPGGAAGGARLALALNRAEIAEGPFGYFLGSYSCREGALAFHMFLPNFGWNPALLPSVYFALAHRARELSRRLTGHGWDPGAFDLARSPLGRALLQLGGERKSGDDGEEE